MDHIDLFSGIGGFALAAKWTGFETVVFCEKDEFCQKVLQKRFGGVVADSMHSRCSTSKNRKTNHGSKEKRGVCQSSRSIPIIPEIRDFDGTKWRGATLLTGGFPCQPFSVAGKRKGKEDDRYLWPQMLRVIKEARPRWILAENVAGIFKMALDTVLADLESEGYSTGTVVIPAASVNAPHRRDRIWIIANCPEPRLERGGKSRKNQGEDSRGQESAHGFPRQLRGLSKSNIANSEGRESGKPTEQKGWEDFGGRNIQSSSDSPSSGLEKSQESQFDKLLLHAQRGSWEIPWIEVATRFCRVDDGVPNRVDRLKSLGNAIVPQVATEIMKGIRITNNAK